MNERAQRGTRFVQPVASQIGKLSGGYIMEDAGCRKRLKSLIEGTADCNECWKDRESGGQRASFGHDRSQVQGSYLLSCPGVCSIQGWFLKIFPSCT